MISRKEDIVYISRQMGHSDPTITLKIYAHLIRRVNPDAAAGLEEAVFG
jgi:integrase